MHNCLHYVNECMIVMFGSQRAKTKQENSLNRQNDVLTQLLPKRFQVKQN